MWDFLIIFYKFWKVKNSSNDQEKCREMNDCVGGNIILWEGPDSPIIKKRKRQDSPLLDFPILRTME